MSAAMLIIDFRVTFEDHKRAQYLFASGDEARAVQEKLAAAAKDYHDCKNDREQMVSFDDASGPVTVDVSSILSIGTDDPMGRAKACHEAWATGVGRLTGLGEAAKKAETEKEAA